MRRRSILGRPCVRPTETLVYFLGRRIVRPIVLETNYVRKRWMGFLNVFSHWLSSLSFLYLNRQVTTTAFTHIPHFFPPFSRFSRRYPHFRSYNNFKIKLGNWSLAALVKGAKCPCLRRGLDSRTDPPSSCRLFVICYWAVQKVGFQIYACGRRLLAF